VDEFELDTPIKIARDLATKMAQGKRPEQLRGVKPVLEKLQATEVDAIATTFDALSLDRAARAAMCCRPGASPFGDGHAAERICEALLQPVSAR